WATVMLYMSDSIDAEVIGRIELDIRSQTLRSSKLQKEQLRELESQRRHLSRLLAMEQNRGARLGDSSVRRLYCSLVKHIQKQIARIDLLINKHIAASPELSAKAHKLTAISGVG